MIPAKFEYLAPESVEEVIKFLQDRGDNAQILSGGHSLIPLMKLRLAEAETLIDIRRLAGLDGIDESNGIIKLGARVTHSEIEHSDLIRDRLPLLAQTASVIGDPQVRNRGTVGGNLAHADPASDLPAAVIALKAQIELVGPDGSRTVAADEFFVDLLTTALEPNEVLTSISFPVPAAGSGWSYRKLAHPASHYAVVGVAVVLSVEDGRCVSASIGITGLGSKAARALGVESALLRGELSDEAIGSAAALAPDGFDPLEDIQASAEYRIEMARVYTRRAIVEAVTRAG